MSTAIVTDSTSDLPPELLDQYPIYQVPALLVLNGRCYRDGQQLTREKFYRQLPGFNPLPTTSSPSLGDFQDQFQAVFSDGYTDIIALHAAGNLSGIYQTAQMAAREFDRRITVIDSGQLSWGLGYQVLTAARAAAQSGDHDDILRIVAEAREQIHLFALLDTLKYVQRSGRVSWTKARLGSLLQVKPLIQLKDGQVLDQGLTRSRKKGYRLLLKTLQQLGALRSLVILHTNPEPEDQHSFLEQVKELTSLEPRVVHVTTVIGTHVGPHGIGFAAVVK